MPTPSIQTLTTDAQQVLNLDSISAVRSVVAVALANANTGTPLNPNLTTQQLWDQFYQVVTRPKSDIESIIANQLMKFLYAPPAPGGAGADKQVIFNDGGVLAGAANLYWDKANNRVGIGTASPAAALVVNLPEVSSAAGTSAIISNTTGGGNRIAALRLQNLSNQWNIRAYGSVTDDLRFGSGAAGSEVDYLSIGNTGIFTWSNVGGVAGTAMTLNSTGLGVGDTPASNTRLTVAAASRLADTTGQAYIHSTDAQAQDIGAQLTLGGLYNASAHYAFGGIAGRKENSTSGNVAGYLDFLTTTSGGSLTSRMRIDSSGNVGIGVTPNTWASYKALQVQSASIFSTTGNDTVYGSNFYYDGAYRFRSASSDKACMYSQFAGQHQWHYTASAGTAGNVATFTQAMTLDASGNLSLANGNLVMGTSGKGIDFSATPNSGGTMISELLNDYEEGTWTGTLTGGTTNPTTPVTATGRYTKVGRVVTVQITFLNANTTGASGLIGITGLPFTNNGSSSSAGAVSLYLIGTFTGSPFASIGVNESFINLFANVSGGAFNDVTHNAGTPRFLTTSITYTV